ncbi:hypothetical protein M2306_000370 [Myroides gitamensis]|uniref:hypothetical protein n=1 Tax=Myroides odoratus TaxID=256 RepID=UPI002168A519|nr:hypothetical protein [Myroides odoratus]MCS4239065.1 hypothetical protein [Myroides odoratus]MDH6599676.1 hypothetical protein [Myroides gitamensis]
MRALRLTILFLCNIQLLLGKSESDKYRFAKQTFKSQNYKLHDYVRFNGEISKLKNGTYKFDEKYLNLQLDNPQYENIFKLGIFNPDIVFGKETSKKTQAELDTLTQKQKVFYNLIRNDSLVICCVKELKELNPNPQTKRFVFWLFRMGMANPTAYYFELYNKNATKKTTIEEFIENARMTFFFIGTIII